jgi:3',5'-cyclic AMP phosphodiesterase CpdA
MNILHLSDLHFHQNNKDNKKAIKTLDNVNTKYPEHYIVITGDIVDDGHEKQYENAFNKLEQFKDRIFIVPGNHDFGALGNFYSKERAKRFDEMLSIPLGQGGTFLAENKPVVNVVGNRSDSIMFIALDTNLETEHPFDFACGEVGDVQLNALSAILANPTIPEMKKVLFFHHHPFMHNNPFMELQDAKKLPRVIYNKVDVILFGHKHEMKDWKNQWGVKYILASDNSPGKSKAGEITIKDGIIKMKYVDI